MPERRFVPKRTPKPVPGAPILGSRITNELEVAKRIRQGLAPTIVGRLASELDLTDKQILRLGHIPPSTFHARKRSGKPLSPEHSSRPYRIAETAEAAVAYLEYGQGRRQVPALQPEGRAGGRDATRVRLHARGQRLRSRAPGTHGARSGQLSRRTTFRIAKAKHRDDTMSGVGAYRAGGRWNSRGRDAVYAAGNLTLAMLEVLVHIDDASAFRSLRHVHHAVTFSDDVVAVLGKHDLPSG